MHSNIVKLGLCIILIAIAYFWHLDRPVLWGDESGTASFSRNVIDHGIPYAFDGRNLLVYENCASISRSLVSSKIPWGQYYIGALSMMLFGESTVGVRLLFAIVGISTFLPLYFVLKRYSRYAAFLSVLILLSPQIILFQRNARYFACIIFLYALLLLIYVNKTISSRLRLILLTFTSILFFQFHHLAALCAFISMILTELIQERKIPKNELFSFFLGFGSWAVFHFSLESVPEAKYTIAHLLLADTLRWWSIFLEGLKVHFLDLDYVNAFPLIPWLFVLCSIPFKGARRVVRKVLGLKLNLMILINLFVQVIASSALLGYETSHKYALLRYMPHLICTSPIPLFFILQEVLTLVITQRNPHFPLIPTAFIILWVSNIVTLSFWLESLPGRTYKMSWWPSVLAEITEPRPEAIRQVMKEIASERAFSNEDAIRVMPAYMNEIFIFYVGHRFIILPKVLRNSECEESIITEIGMENWERFFKKPKWIIVFFGASNVILSGYEMNQIPLYRHAPDASRPELTRHGFIESLERPAGFVSIYKKVR